MNEIKIFENPQFGSIRSVMVDDEPWFVGRDVASVLGYKDTVNAIKVHVDDDDKQKGVAIHHPVAGTQKTNIINESGLYSLILSSKLPSAKKFKRWVTSDVLPSIRKHGLYANAETVEAMLADPDVAIRLLTNLKEERAKRAEVEAKLEQAHPKVIFADAVAASKTSILIGDLAKILKQNGINMGQKRLFEWLRQHGYLIKRKGSEYNSPTQKAMEMKLFEIKENTIPCADGHIIVNKTTKVTGKGQIYFINLFKKEADADADN